MEGYSVTEAASVLGVPTERVWELLARGVLSGAPEGETGMRVYLQPRPAPAPPEPRPSNGHGASDRAEPERELSPFRELLTEFRNLTERYGQALLALGESRGEVAALRSRVDLLEARMELRLPTGTAAAAPMPWPATPMPTVPERPVGPVASPPAEQPPAAEAEETEEHRAHRRRAQRHATESFAEALARAQDPTAPELPGGTETAAAVAVPQEEIDASLPRDLPVAEPIPSPEEVAEPEPVSAMPTAPEPEAVAATAEPEPEPEPMVDAEPESEVAAEFEPDVVTEASGEPQPEVATEVEPESQPHQEVTEPHVAPAPEAEPAVIAAHPEADPEPSPEREGEPQPEPEMARPEQPTAEAAALEASGPSAEPAPPAQPISWDRDRYTTDIEEPDWFEAEPFDELPAEPPAEPSPEPVGADEAPASEAAPESLTAAEDEAAAERPDEETSAQPTAEDETIPQHGGHAEAGWPAEDQPPEGAPAEPSRVEARLPGSFELDEALAALRAMARPSDAPRREPNEADDEGQRRAESPRPPASRAYRRLRRIFPG